MKSNLDAAFKTDSSLETKGVWFEFASGASFLVRRMGGSNSIKLKEAHARHVKPVARLLESGDLPREKMIEIEAKTFVDVCLSDWKGIVIDGVDTEFNRDVAIALLISLPELLSKLTSLAVDSNNYLENLGNS